jgi:hypothetical protein
MRTLTQITAAEQRQPRMVFGVKPGESIFSGVPSIGEVFAQLGTNK